MSFSNRNIRWGMLLTCFLVLSPIAFAAEQHNVVLIVIDDAGLMDLGAFGGEASTPNIDAIADSGIRFSNYHSSPLCAPSRAMLLTGVDSHRTGVGTIGEVLTKEQAKLPAYSLRLNEGVRTVADKLRDSGYQTFMTGKWHLGSGDGDLPVHHGFDRSFILDASGADNWEQKHYLPFYESAPWFEDDQPADLPEDFYSSEFLVDKMIDYLERGDEDKPFFSYVAFQAIHIPIQAPKEFIDRYEGVYREGWDSLLTTRYEKAKSLGIIPEDAAPPVMHSRMRRWESLTDEERIWFERAMMVNAGMLEAMDFHIGRLVDYLKQRDDFDNTVFIIASDNGPEYNLPHTGSAAFTAWLDSEGYHYDVERLGLRRSMAAIGPEWASAASSPGRLFKFHGSEGATRVPLIMTGPGIKPQGFHQAFTHVTDITPSILGLTGASEEVAQQGEPMIGRSLGKLLSGEDDAVYTAFDSVGMEVAGNGALFKGDHKLTRNALPYGDGQWHLYNIVKDPGETNDLSSQEPALKQVMLSDFADYEKATGVFSLSDSYNIRTQLGKNLVTNYLERRRFMLLGMLGLLLVVGIVVGRWWTRC